MAAGQKQDPFTARLIDTAASGYAGYAAERLLANHPETRARFGGGAFGSWKEHFASRLRELSAAVAAGEPRLFTSQVLWSRRAFEAREVPVDDLEASLRSLREVLAEELPEEAAATACAFLDHGLAALADGDSVAPSRLDAATPTGRLAYAYLEALLTGERDKAIDLVIDSVRNGLAVRSAYLDVLLPAQQEIGHLWHTDQLGIAQEHLVSATTGSLMTLLRHRETPKAANGKTVVTAGVAGNAHDLGLRAVSDFFELDGWRVIFLGCDLPHDAIADAASQFGADLVALSASLPAQVPKARQAIEAIRASRPEAKILVGGTAFLEAPDLAQRIGADAWAGDLEEAITVGCRLVGLGADAG